MPSQGDLPNAGIKPRPPTLQADSLPAEPPGKSKNIGVGSLSLLQGIFLPQESNRGLPHCRWILYQLSYQGSSKVKVTQSCPTLRPHGLYSPWSSPSQNTGVGSSFPSPVDLPNPGIKQGSHALQVDFLPTELSGKPHI